VFYRRQCRLPARIKGETGQIVMTVGEVAAITTPGALGARVKSALESRHIEVGPIITHPRSRRWTFLAIPDIRFGDLDLYAEMYRIEVTVPSRGAEVALPSPADQLGTLRVWNVLPGTAYRPSAAVLLEIIRRCAGLRPRQRSIR
jgi:hypothetical protein